MLSKKQSSRKKSDYILAISAVSFASSLTIFIIYKFKVQASLQDLVIKLSLAMVALSSAALVTAILCNALNEKKVEMDVDPEVYAEILDLLAEERINMSSALMLEHHMQLYDAIQEMDQLIAGLQKTVAEKENSQHTQQLQQQAQEPNEIYYSGRSESNPSNQSYVSLEYNNSSKLHETLKSLQRKIQGVAEELEELEEQQNQENTQKITENIASRNKEFKGLERHRETLQTQIKNLEENIVSEEDKDATIAFLQEKVKALEERQEESDELWKEADTEDGKKEGQIEQLSKELKEARDKLNKLESRQSPAPQKSRKDYEDEARENLQQWQTFIIPHLFGLPCDNINKLNNKAQGWKKNNQSDATYISLSELLKDEKKVIEFLEKVKSGHEIVIESSYDCSVIEYIYHTSTMYQMSLRQINEGAEQHPSYGHSNGPTSLIFSGENGRTDNQPFQSLPYNVSNNEKQESGYNSEDKKPNNTTLKGANAKPLNGVTHQVNNKLFMPF